MIKKIILNLVAFCACTSLVLAPRDRRRVAQGPAPVIEEHYTERFVCDPFGNQLFILRDRIRNNIFEDETPRGIAKMIDKVAKKPRKYIEFPERDENWHTNNRGSYQTMLQDVEGLDQSMLEYLGIAYSLSHVMEAPEGKIKSFLGQLLICEMHGRKGYCMSLRAFFVKWDRLSLSYFISVVPSSSFYTSWHMNILSTRSELFQRLNDAGITQEHFLALKQQMDTVETGSYPLSADLLKEIIKRNDVPIVFNYIHGLRMSDPILAYKKDIPQIPRIVQEQEAYKAQFLRGVLRCLCHSEDANFEKHIVQAPRALRDECLHIMSIIDEPKPSGAFYVYKMTDAIWETLEKRHRLKFAFFAAAQENTGDDPGGRCLMLISPNIKGDIFEIKQRIRRITNWRNVDMDDLLVAPREEIETGYCNVSGFFPKIEYYEAFLRLGRQVSRGESKLPLYNYVTDLHLAKWDPEKTELYSKLMSIVAHIKLRLETEGIKGKSIKECEFQDESGQTISLDQACRNLAIQKLSTELKYPGNENNNQLKYLFDYANRLSEAGWNPANIDFHIEFMSMVENCKKERLQQAIRISPIFKT